MEIDEDYLRTETALGYRASRELCSNFLLYIVTHNHSSFEVYQDNHT